MALGPTQQVLQVVSCVWAWVQPQCGIQNYIKSRLPGVSWFPFLKQNIMWQFWFLSCHLKITKTQVSWVDRISKFSACLPMNMRVRMAKQFGNQAEEYPTFKECLWLGEVCPKGNGRRCHRIPEWKGHDDLKTVKANLQVMIKISIRAKEIKLMSVNIFHKNQPVLGQTLEYSHYSKPVGFPKNILTIKREVATAKAGGSKKHQLMYLTV